MKRLSNWGNGFVEWTVGNRAFLSVAFSWLLPAAYERAVWHKSTGLTVRAGGPAVYANRDYLKEVTEPCQENISAVHRHNPNACFTSRGCPKKCPYCIVPKIEGGLKELTDWEPKPIVCDNNLLACSRKHFDKVIHKLKPLKGVDFNQGLDAQYLTSYHADRLAELDCIVRLAWDNTLMEKQFMAAFEQLRKVGFSKRSIRVYVLIGFNDTPEDALYRLQTIRDLGAVTNPMRFQPLSAKQKNRYIAPGWTHYELQRFMKYWTNWRRLGSIPFEDFDPSARFTKATKGLFTEAQP